MDIDAEIEAGINVPAANAQPEADATPQVEEQKPETETKEGDVPDAEGSDAKPEEVFPKKALNALSYRDKKIGKLQANLELERQARQELERKLSEYNAPKQKPGDGRPQESDYTRYSDYMEALSDWKLDQRFKSFEGKQNESATNQQEAIWAAERLKNIDVQEAEISKQFTDYHEVEDEYSEVVEALPPQIQRLFLEADNAPLAFYNLAKNGKLEGLATMSLAKAAMEIGRAQTQATPPPKPQTKAPAPIPAARGSVPVSKQLDQMTPEELLKWVKS